MRACRKTVEKLYHTRLNELHRFAQKQMPAKETDGSYVFPQRLRLLFTEQKERNLFSISASQEEEKAKKELHKRQHCCFKWSQALSGSGSRRHLLNFTLI